ncbi:hypothetical protein MTR_8g467980 [Medicago truncatula]|uniref:Uncharacterized protein n=1 Tax=Medicago truncatula TaxID=3880 RepID=A0A072TSC2_MEDTR|nr:hypothetical protein MTR_8g467980 [Medicago truncatula]
MTPFFLFRTSPRPNLIGFRSDPSPRSSLGPGMALLAHKIAAFSIEHLTYLGIRAHACTPPSSGEGLTTDELQLDQYSTKDTWKVRDDMINWVCRQANRARFTIFIVRCNLKKSMLLLACEWNGDYKAPKKKVKLEATGSKKCGC